MNFIYDIVNQNKKSKNTQTTNYYTQIFSYICDCIHLDGEAIEIAPTPDNVVHNLISYYNKKCLNITNMNEINDINQKICFIYVNSKYEQNHINDMLSLLTPGGIILICTDKSKIEVIKKPIPVKPMSIERVDKWSVIHHNWGDTIASLGFMHYYMGESSIAFTGFSEDIINFLKVQDFVSGIIDYRQHRMQNPFISSVSQISKLLREEYPQTKIVLDCAFWKTICKPILPPPLNLPDTSKQYAANFIKPINGKIIMVHPYSLASCLLNMHWGYWMELMNYLFHTFKDYTFILTGINGDIWGANHFDNLPNVINLVDKTPSNCHVFALTSLSDYTICTANSISHWARNQSKPCSIIMTKNSEATYPWKTIYEMDIKNSEVLYTDNSLLSNTYSIYKQLYNL